METLFEQLQPVMLEAISVVLMAAIVYVTNLVRKKTGLEIEARHREALHSALMTGVQSAIKDGPQAAKSQIIEEAVAYARFSVPKAIAQLGPDNFLLRKIAERYANQVMVKIENRLLD